jgi:protein-S-isoprenylcysteine O-methyltransferase Ste14
MRFRVAILVYGTASYALFLLTSLYAVGFVGGFPAPTRLDGPRRDPIGIALAADLGLIVLFALQHSGMARPGFKRWWTRYVPEPAERSSYVLLSSVALLVLFWFWRPVGGVIWLIEHRLVRAALHTVFGLGWVLVLASTCLINHFDLFGLRQVWLAFRARPYTPLPFTTPVLYRVVRHPLYVGWLLAFWATPRMTVTHLVFAGTMTAYILAAIGWEERDLAGVHPQYAAYRRRVPMLIPRWRKLPAGVDSGADRGPAMSPASLAASRPS